MKTRKLRLLSVSSLLVLLALACATFAGPTPTPTPVPLTATASPTPTPDYEAIIEDGWAAFDDDDIETATTILGEVMAADESLADAWALSAAIHSTNQEYDEAIEDLERALAIDADNERALEKLPIAYQVRISELINFVRDTYDPDAIIDSIREARRVLDKMNDFGGVGDISLLFNVVLNSEPDYGIDNNIPDDAYNHFEQAEEFFRNDQYSQAITEYSNAIDDYEEFAVAYLYLGDTYFVQGEYEQAIGFMEQAVEINPRLVQGWSFLGDAYTNLGLAQHARDAYLHALYLDIENEIAYNGLTRINNALGHWESDFFIPYEFTFYFDPSAETNIAGGEVLGDPSVEQGGTRIDTSDHLAIIFWQPWELDPIDVESGGAFIASIFANEPATTLVGEAFEFQYGEELIAVQLYDYDSPDDDIARNGANAITSCDGRLFVMQFEYAEEDINDLVVLIAPYLESFRCDLE